MHRILRGEKIEASCDGRALTGDLRVGGVALATVVAMLLLASPGANTPAQAEAHQRQGQPVLTTAAEVHEPGTNIAHGVRVHLTGTIRYFDVAKGLLFVEDSTGGAYVRISKPYPVHVGDTVSVDGLLSVAHVGEVAENPEIQVMLPVGRGEVSLGSWFSLQHVIDSLFGVAVLALGVAVWAAFLRWRVANQSAWIDHSLTIARERTRILELISTNRNLEQALKEICESAKSLLPGTEWSYELYAEAGSRRSDGADAPLQTTGKTLYEAPLKDDADQEVGRIAGFCGDGYEAQEGCDEVYRVTGELSALAMRQAYLYRGLVHHSTHDPLTDLPNRRLYEIRLNEVLSEAQEKGREMAVIYIDINRFKYVNDQFGHKIGDLYLKQIAERLRHKLRPEDMLARVGGDEFVVIAPFQEEYDRVFALTARLQRCFSDPFELDGISIDGSASFGFARYPEHGTTAEELTRYADHAMYVAKHEDRISEQEHSVAIITPNELELAFFNHRYRLAYQPQFSSSGRLKGMEALIRLDHPTLGLLTPEAFVAVAEKDPIIIDIGAWALRRAVEDAKSWGLDAGDEVSIAVNVAARQMEQPGYARSVLACLKQHEFPPERLEIELIERSLMFSGEKVVEQLVQLRAAGVRVSLDDFGTEQSCLSILHKLPIDTIKLDRSFIRAMDSEPEVLPIVQAIVSMARSLDKRVVAEAIEHVGPVPALMKMGEMDFQGYLLSRPVPSELVPSLIEEWRSGIAMPSVFQDGNSGASAQLTLHEVPRMRIA